MEGHGEMIYVALGSYVILKRKDATKIVRGLIAAMDKGLTVACKTGLPFTRNWNFLFLLVEQGLRISH